MLGEVPELVDFLFLEDRAGSTPTAGRRPSVGDEVAPQILADALAAYEACRRGTRTRCTRSRWPSASRSARKLGKAQAPIRVAVTGRHAWACRSSSRSRCSAETRPAAAWRPRSTACRRAALMLLAPLRWALRIADPLRDGHRPLLRRHPGAGLADLAPVRPAPGRGHRGDGGGAVQRYAHATSRPASTRR